MFSLLKRQVEVEERHSNFWIGLYRENWLIAFDSCQEWVESMLSFLRNKRHFISGN
jgi:hypothetical protein